MHELQPGKLYPDSRFYPTNYASSEEYCLPSQQLERINLNYSVFEKYKDTIESTLLERLKMDFNPYDKAIIVSALKSLTAAKEEWLNNHTTETLDAVGPQPITVWQYVALTLDRLGLHRGAEILMATRYMTQPSLEI